MDAQQPSWAPNVNVVIATVTGISAWPLWSWLSGQYESRRNAKKSDLQKLDDRLEASRAQMMDMLTAQIAEWKAQAVAQNKIIEKLTEDNLSQREEIVRYRAQNLDLHEQLLKVREQLIEYERKLRL